MGRSEREDGRGASRRAPPSEPPPPLFYWPATVALAGGLLWFVLAVVSAADAGDGRSYLLRTRLAVGVVLIGVAAVVLALGARHDLDRLGPSVRARGAS